VWNLLNAVKGSDVVEGIDAWGETAVETKDLAVDKSGEGEVIEKVGEILPDIGVSIFTEALVIEAVDLCDLAGFVVSAEDRDSLWVSNLESNEEGNGLDGVITSINVIA
jgi:hypothetical protein